MKFYLAEHQNKGWSYARALENAGWMRTEDLGEDLQLALFDHDVGNDGHGFRRGLEELHARGVAVMLYPHGARPMIQWDGVYPVWPHTRLQILIAEGHRAVMQNYGYPISMEVCGWAMCEQRPWQAPDISGRPVEVLFGPIHPNRNSWLHPLDQAQNALMYQKLLETPGIHITVRHIMALERNGLWRAPGVKYVLVNPNGSTEDIDKADVVIGHQTFAFLAVARGKPLVMYGDDRCPHSGNHWENLRWAQHYDAYRELMRYPIEGEAARTGKDLRSLIDQAVSDDAGSAWREMFIGKPMDPKQFVATVERFL